MEQLSRRNFLQNSLGTLLTFSLARSLCNAQALKGGVGSVARPWVMEMESLTRSMLDSKIKQKVWQDQLETLLARVDLKDLMKAIDYDALEKNAVFPDDHESALGLEFPGPDGKPAELSYAPYFYAMKKGVAIVPHGHQNMTSMHMILKGETHGRQFERVADEPHYLIIKPTKDLMLKPGELSTISDERDNIHWLKATTGPVFMFNIGVFGIDRKRSFTGRDYIDPANGEKLKDGLIRARRIEVKEAYKLYGNS